MGSGSNGFISIFIFTSTTSIGSIPLYILYTSPYSNRPNYLLPKWVQVLMDSCAFLFLLPRLRIGSIPLYILFTIASGGRSFWCFVLGWTNLPTIRTLFFQPIETYDEQKITYDGKPFWYETDDVRTYR